MRVIFVGVHNKPNKPPLCSSTKSGKLINRIIENLDSGWTSSRWWLKTNLYNTDFLPEKTVKEKESVGFFYRVQPSDSDIFVLLGAEVARNFFNKNAHNVIEVHHPASKRSHLQMDAYISDCVVKINEKINSIK